MSTLTSVSPSIRTTGRPMLTLDGVGLLEQRAAWLREEEIPPLRAAVARRPGDWLAELDLDRALAELDTLETTLDVAGIIPVSKSDPSTVELGDLAIVEFPRSGGREARVERFRLVHPIEAPLDTERISVESPLARALIGARIGQTVTVAGPSRPRRVRVLAAIRPNPPPGSR